MKKNLFLLAVFSAYALACLSPLWGLGLESSGLVIWSGALAALLLAGLWRYLSPVRAYPAADLGFIVPVILSINLFSSILGPDRGLLQPLYFLVVALCALYYPVGFNFIVAGLIFVLEAAAVFLTRGTPGLPSAVGLLVFGVYLAGAVAVLGRLFKSEQKKKERAVRTARLMQEGAAFIDTGDDDPTPGPAASASRMAESAADFDKAMKDLLDNVRVALPSDNAVLFMPDSAGENVYVRVHSGTGRVRGVTIPLGNGLVGWVAREKAPLLVQDSVKDLDYLEDGANARSFLAAPVLNAGFMEGLIALDSSAENAFKDSDKEALARFCKTMVYLLQNARAYTHADINAKKFETLHKISAEVSSSLELGTIFDNLASSCGGIIPYDYLTISLVEGQGEATFRKVTGYTGAPPPGPVPLAGSLLGWIVENRHLLSLNDLRERTEKTPLFPGNLFRGECRSFIGIPFISQDKVLGVITLAMRQAGAISASQQQMLSIIANQVAVSIAHAQTHQAMLHMATTDGLTGLFNHRHFQEKADEEFLRAGRYPAQLSVLLIDIDHFKNVNDTYGHPVGDAILKRVARKLRETVRSVDITARYGGEEFVALLLNTDAKGAHQMAERVRKNIEKSRFLLQGKNIPITISVGCATYPDDATEKKELILMADQALYWAKGHGRNQSWAYKAVAGAGKAG